MNKRVVITGIGVVSPVGIGINQFWKNVVAGVSGVDRSPLLEKSDCRCKIAGEVKDFRPEEWIGRKEAKRTDRFTQLGLAAAYVAIEDAALVLEKENCERIGVTLGTAYAGWLFATQEYGVYRDKGADWISPHTGIAVFTGSCGGQIALRFGLKAPCITISTGCDCSTAAAAHAANLIVRGDADVMLAGGAEAPVHPPIIAALGASYALSDRNGEPQKASRPFDFKRDGFIMAEGACVLVLEEFQHARDRGARIYAELIGWGSTCDAYHMCEPAPDGAQGARALRIALAEAGVRPDQVDYINAHGTSTPRGDRAETLVVRQVFGEHAYNVPISSVKSVMGHTQGACGAIEIAACCLAMRDNILPPTINYEYPDPECDLDYVPNVARRRRVDIAASNSFSFGGRNTAVVLKRYQDERASHPNAVNGKFSKE
jgi:3-oxoacyl-[acyl-carrier-protein] synthase II